MDRPRPADNPNHQKPQKQSPSLKHNDTVAQCTKIINGIRTTNISFHGNFKQNSSAPSKPNTKDHPLIITPAPQVNFKTIHKSYGDYSNIVAMLKIDLDSWLKNLYSLRKRDPNPTTSINYLNEISAIIKSIEAKFFRDHKKFSEQIVKRMIREIRCAINSWMADACDNFRHDVKNVQIIKQFADKLINEKFNDNYCTGFQKGDSKTDRGVDESNPFGGTVGGGAGWGGGRKGGRKGGFKDRSRDNWEKEVAREGLDRTLYMNFQGSNRVEHGAFTERVPEGPQTSGMDELIESYNNGRAMKSEDRREGRSRYTSKRKHIGIYKTSNAIMTGGKNLFRPKGFSLNFPHKILASLGGSQRSPAEKLNATMPSNLIGMGVDGMTLACSNKKFSE
jgi:hypothetical protein